MFSSSIKTSPSQRPYLPFLSLNVLMTTTLFNILLRKASRDLMPSGFVGPDRHKLPEDPRTESVSGDDAFGFALASDLWSVDAEEPYLLRLYYNPEAKVEVYRDGVAVIYFCDHGFVLIHCNYISTDISFFSLSNLI